jgi:hypothetical protein
MLIKIPVDSDVRPSTYFKMFLKFAVPTAVIIYFIQLVALPYIIYFILSSVAVVGAWFSISLFYHFLKSLFRTNTGKKK